MRLLLLSDLHDRDDWFAWVSKHKADAVLVAGDLLDGFAECGLLPQMLRVEDWCRSSRLPLALSSGNHDGNTSDHSIDPESIATLDEAARERVAALIFSPRWMDTLERPGVITDGRTAELRTPAGSVVVTTIPYSFDSEPSNPDLWRAGALLRKQIRAPWVVLHHDPPADTAVGGMMGDSSAFYRIREYQPNFVVSGHLHDQPYRGGFADRIGNTWCFNPGAPTLARALKSRIPNHIMLDLATQTATWHATPNVGHKTISQTVPLS